MVGDAVGVDWQTTKLVDFVTSWAIVLEFANDARDAFPSEDDSLHAGRLAKQHLEFLRARNACYHALELQAVKRAWMTMIPVSSGFRPPDSFFIKRPAAILEDVTSATVWH